MVCSPDAICTVSTRPGTGFGSGATIGVIGVVCVFAIGASPSATGAGATTMRAYWDASPRADADSTTAAPAAIASTLPSPDALDNNAPRSSAPLLDCTRMPLVERQSATHQVPLSSHTSQWRRLAYIASTTMSHVGSLPTT